MTAFSRLIELLIEVGFERSNSYMSGSYRVSTESLSVTVYLGCYSSITIFVVEQPNRYKVCFFFTYSLRIKDLIMSFKELEEMLLISIIRNSFLTEEETTKAYLELPFLQ